MLMPKLLKEKKSYRYWNLSNFLFFEIEPIYTTRFFKIKDQLTGYKVIGCYSASAYCTRWGVVKDYSTICLGKFKTFEEAQECLDDLVETT